MGHQAVHHVFQEATLLVGLASGIVQAESDVAHVHLALRCSLAGGKGQHIRGPVLVAILPVQLAQLAVSGEQDGDHFALTVAAMERSAGRGTDAPAIHRVPALMVHDLHLRINDAHGLLVRAGVLAGAGSVGVEGSVMPEG